METLLQDLRYGARLLVKRPGFTAVAVLTLALGIGASTAIFSVVNGVLLRPLPYADPDELFIVWQDYTRRGGPPDEWASADNFFDWRDSNEVFEGIFLVDGFGPTLTGADEPRMLNGAAASWDAFQILGVEPMLGRSFRREEDTASSELVVVLGHAFWQQQFNGDEGILGATLTLSGTPATVVGVMPPNFKLPMVPDNDIFAPLRLDRTNSCGRGCVTVRAIGRLKDGISLDRAQADMSAIAARLGEQYPEPLTGVGVNLESLHERIVGPVRAGLLVLLSAVGFVLLIACANVANLMLARAIGREREVAIRLAMGASRGRLFQQMLTESLTLALGGAAIGLLVALWSVDVLVSLVPASVPRFDEVNVDGAALTFTLLVAVTTGLLFGLVPALRASSPQLNQSLKEGGRGSSVGVGGRHFRAALVVAEVALALTLLVGGGLLMRSFLTLISVDPGFNADNLLTQQLFLPNTRYPEPQQMVSFVDTLLDRVGALPGVEDTGVINVLPLGDSNVDASFLIEGRPRPQTGERPPVAWYRPASPGYFETMKMRLVRGRWFTERDHQEAPLVVTINEEAARRYWPNEDPMGQRITFGRDVWRGVVGVIADTKHFGLDQAPRPAMYMPYKQVPQRFMSLMVRTDGDPRPLARAIRTEVNALDPDMAVAGVATMREVISSTVAGPRLVMVLLVSFAASAMALAAIGLYGVMSYSVDQRTQEIGIRMAMGARAGDVERLVVGRGMTLLAVGVAIGLGTAFALTRFLESLLFEVSVTDPVTFVAVPAVLAAVALLACYVPARRAARVDPLEALRYE